MRKVFAPFGAIRNINMSFEPVTGRSKGFAFVDFEQGESAAMALQTMNGFQLAGRPLKVGRPAPGGTGGGREGGGLEGWEEDDSSSSMVEERWVVEEEEEGGEEEGRRCMWGRLLLR